MFCRIEPDGGISLSREGHGLYTVTPYDGKGVSILEDGKRLGTLRVENDTVQGQIKILWTAEGPGSETEIIRYDPLTGVTLG